MAQLLNLIQLVHAYKNAAKTAEAQTLAEAIVNEVNPSMKKFVFNQKLGEDDSKDVLQETMLEILDSLSNFNGACEREFWGWCYKIARRRVAKFLKENGQDLIESYHAPELEETIDEVAERTRMSAQDLADYKLCISILTKAADECLKLLTRYFVEGWDYQSIAEMFELASADAARMRLVRCREQAQKLLETHN